MVRMSGRSALRPEDGYEDGVSLGPEAAQPVRHEGRGDQLEGGGWLEVEVGQQPEVDLPGTLDAKVWPLQLYM